MDAALNYLDIFTQSELAGALGLCLPRDQAVTLAAAVYRIDPDEKAHYDWNETILSLPALSSEELRARVLDRFAFEGSQRDGFEARTRQVKSVLDHWRRTAGGLGLEDVVIDRREPG